MHLSCRATCPASRGRCLAQRVALLRPVARLLHLVRVASGSLAPASSGVAPINELLTSRIPAAAILLLAVSAPIEIPVSTIGARLTLTTTEAGIAIALMAVAIVHLYSPRAIEWRTPITPAAVAGLAVLMTAALFAPHDRGVALRFVGRMLAAAAVFIVAINAFKTRELARTFVQLLLSIGVVVSIVAMLEVAQIQAVLQGLTIFRPGFHVVGGQLRATSTLLYPTIASMYLEIVFVLGLWLLVDPPNRSNRTLTAVTLTALAIIAAGIVATFTRAGVIAMGVALIVVATLRYLDRRRFDGGHLLLAALAAIVICLVLASRSRDVLLARFDTEGSGNWYGATYAAPAALRFRTGGVYLVPVTLENTGRVVWDSTDDPMFAMGYHWLRADTGAVVQFDGWRTPFPSAVAPGARVALPVAVRAPGEPGEYVLVWDVVHEHRAWLSTEGVPPGRTRVVVDGERVSATATMMPRLPGSTTRPDRPTLWGTALRMAGDHPITGVGPDNFRMVYGRYLGLSTWDTRVHANNMYLEVLTGAGVAGLVALLWLVASSGAALLRAWFSSSNSSVQAASAALVALWLVVAGHGLVDSFLSFTTTYVMFALAAGLAFSPALHPRAAADADRV